MNGVRSTQAPDSQNLATLSRPKDSTASGGFPPLIADRILSSSWPGTSFTVIQGYWAANPSKIDSNCSVCRGSVHSLQIVIVTGSWEALGSSVWGAVLAPPPPPPAVHAEPTNPATTRASVTLG